MADPAEENPFDALAKIVQPAKTYEEARKLVWTALKSETLSTDKVVTILISATAMPAMAAANIQMEKILKAHGLIAAPQQPAEEQPQVANAIAFPKKPAVN